jgi:ribosome-associated protein
MSFRVMMFAVATIFLALVGLPVASTFTVGHHHTASTTSLQLIFRPASFWRGISNTHPVFPSQRLKNAQKLHVSSEAEAEAQTPTPLCDLQTFLRFTRLVPNGGAAKTAIQAGECLLNGEVELRRAKKLFPGDSVSFKSMTLDVSEEVAAKDYVYKVKTKKVKPLAKVDTDGTLEFGGRFRSEEWRKERKWKKAERKVQNKLGKSEEEEEE